jgi:hypothetical protein
MFVNAHAIAKKRAATLIRAGINRQDGDATTASTRHIGKRRGE